MAAVFFCAGFFFEHLGPVKAKADQEHVEALDRAEWRRWLAEHHRRAEGVWLVTFKKASGQPHLDYNSSVEEALCFGWIDSKPGKVDALRTKLWLAPRKPRTGWSKANKDRVERLFAAGKIQAAGLAKIAAAKTDGSWSKLDAVEKLEVPPDLAIELEKHSGASAWFGAFPPSARRGILEWILQAKRPETRAKRIVETARLAAKNERANQWRKQRP